jgi:hypothetical protein
MDNAFQLYEKIAAGLFVFSICGFVVRESDRGESESRYVSW